MKAIFLSASIPIESRDHKYFETADVIAIRDAVVALCNVCLSNDIRIVWGGHPAINPLVYDSIKRHITHCDTPIFDEKDTVIHTTEDTNAIQKYVKLFLSNYYKDKFPPNINQFDNVHFIDAKEDRESSLLEMRKRMIDSEKEYIAGIFIGGMEGVEKEYALFSKMKSESLVLPIASTGAAAKILFDNYKSACGFNDDLEINFAYHSLFTKYLLNNDNR